MSSTNDNDCGIKFNCGAEELIIIEIIHGEQFELLDSAEHISVYAGDTEPINHAILLHHSTTTPPTTSSRTRIPKTNKYAGASLLEYL